MNYTLNEPDGQQDAKKGIDWSAFKNFWPMVQAEKENLVLSVVAVLISSALNLAAPVLVGYAIDHYVIPKQYPGLFWISGLLLAMYLVALAVGYYQMMTMGGVGQRVIFRLRAAIFHKLQELPVAFFNQNKAGDLISRINNDTEKLNMFFSQALTQFIGNGFLIVGAAACVLYLSPKLGGTALLPAIVLLVFTVVTSSFVKRKNAVSLERTGDLSAEIQESINHFKVIVAFNRRDYFRQKFAGANERNYKAAIGAGLVNTVFLTPIYQLVSNLAQMIVLGYGIYLISAGQFTLGLLISFLTYVMRFYDPLRQIAQLWAMFQTALAAWDRISAILSLKSNLALVASNEETQTSSVLRFDEVSFGYADSGEILHNVSFDLEQGKTYALVGPTGGGKTTTASLMARLYDPTKGTVRLSGKDIRSYTDADRTKKIGFILQEPFLFTGTVGENIVYGSDEYREYSGEKLMELLKAVQLEGLLARFDQGLETPVAGNGEAMSLGQRQLIAFMRAVLRKPDLLILDEATANIDTVTEQLLEEILAKLPKATTRVIIAHRLNTIKNADEIFFVNSGEIVRAGSFDHAVEMLMDRKRES